MDWYYVCFYFGHGLVFGHRFDLNTMQRVKVSLTLFISGWRHLDKNEMTLIGRVNIIQSIYHKWSRGICIILTLYSCYYAVFFAELVLTQQQEKTTLTGSDLLQNYQ